MFKMSCVLVCALCGRQMGRIKVFDVLHKLQPRIYYLIFFFTLNFQNCSSTPRAFSVIV